MHHVHFAGRSVLIVEGCFLGFLLVERERPFALQVASVGKHHPCKVIYLQAQLLDGAVGGLLRPFVDGLLGLVCLSEVDVLHIGIEESLVVLDEILPHFEVFLYPDGIGKLEGEVLVFLRQGLCQVVEEAVEHVQRVVFHAHGIGDFLQCRFAASVAQHPERILQAHGRNHEVRIGHLSVHLKHQLVGKHISL